MKRLVYTLPVVTLLIFSACAYMSEQTSMAYEVDADEQYLLACEVDADEQYAVAYEIDMLEERTGYSHPYLELLIELAHDYFFCPSTEPERSQFYFERFVKFADEYFICISTDYFPCPSTNNSYCPAREPRRDFYFYFELFVRDAREYFGRGRPYIQTVRGYIYCPWSRQYFSYYQDGYRHFRDTWDGALIGARRRAIEVDGMMVVSGLVYRNQGWAFAREMYPLWETDVWMNPFLIPDDLTREAFDELRAIDTQAVEAFRREHSEMPFINVYDFDGVTVIDKFQQSVRLLSLD